MLTQARLKELLHYDAISGVFTWLIGTRRIRAGTIAGTKTDKGYIHICVDRKKYKAHRLAWLYVTGVWPIDELDHKNTVRDDNALENLRNADASFNAQNRKRSNSSNRSGFLGVQIYGKKFRATINIKGVQYRLGVYATAKEAHDAYLNVKRQLHPGCTI